MKNSAKKYMLLQLYLLLVLPMIGQIAPITLPADGDWPTIVGDSIMLIGPKQEALTEEQRYFNPPYLLVYPGKEHLKEQMIRAALCDCDPTKPNRRIGVFSVAPDKQVSFSQGNLQYLPAANIWKFANTQYEYLGNANKYLTPTFRNWVDLFGWSANNSTAPFGVSTSTNNADYAGNFVDWGTNAIQGDAANTWRTMGKDEWEYLIQGRKNAANLIGVALVNGVNGLIILPDEWVCPNGVNFVSGFATNEGIEYYKDMNTYSLEQWKLLEAAGAVFMPTAGRRSGQSILNLSRFGNYWSSTPKNNDYKHYLAYTSATNYVDAIEPLYIGRSVRLVHDTIVPPPAPCETITVNGVSFNMMCVEGEKYDYLMGQTEVTRALWKAVMGKLPNGSTATDVPVDNVTWGDCQEFITQLNSLTGLHFRFPTKDEWLYAAKGGQYEEDFLYSGSDNIDEVGWYDGNTPGGVQPVAQLKPNALGIYDMTGNVWEWVLQTSNSAHLYMGGSYAFNATSCLLGNKGTATSPDHKGSIGLRLVLDTHQYVDLGLSVMWATTNVGAETPEQYGDYFAWGETEPKTEYTWKTYKLCDGTVNNMTKYNPTDGLTTLLPEDDAAHVNWGGEWRMAGDAEWTELREQCDWKWTTINGTKGYTVTGPNGNSIFLSAAGFYYASGLSYVNNHGDYWSGTRNSTSASSALHAYFTSDLLIRSSSWRYYGFPVRPVLPTDREILTPSTPGKRIGLFSVGKGKHVTFSQGNLMYLKLKDQWLFAPNQLYYTGERHLKNGQIADTVMYFAWSAKDSRAPWGISTSINLDHYKGEFLDWGTNTIQGDKPDTWRSMTDDEVVYLFEGRNNAAKLVGFAQVDGTNGMIVLPDDWQLPTGLSFTPYDGTTVNQYTLEQWQQMEDAGAVILPCAGYFNYKLSPKMRGVGEVSYLPYSVLQDSIHQQYTYIKLKKIIQRWPGDNTGNLFYAFPRRLVRDTIIPQYVDLGLSVKWANYNLGASTPSGYGDYYAWGETEPKENYSLSAYKYYDSSTSQYIKYTTTDALKILQPEDDAAQMQKGGHWRMPTKEEINELINNCTWTWTQQNGINGFEATAANGNSIFFPAGGYKGSGGPSYPVGEYGLYWMLNDADNQYANLFFFDHENNNSPKVAEKGLRRFGFLIRPVYDENYHAYIDLGLSVYWATTNISATAPEEYGDYFAWGETEPKDNFTWENYKWCEGTKSTITKYNAADGLTILLPEDDAAYVNWGREWRMPTNDELTELRTLCTWEAETINGVKGAKVTGPNGNSIFIPLGGSYNTFDDQLNSVGTHGWLYSSAKASADQQAQEIGISSSGGAQTSCSRCLGLNIRPVVPKPDDGKVTVRVVPTTSGATVSLLCLGYTREGNSITVDKGKSVLYLVSNVAGRYLSQGDSLLNLTRDTTLYVGLEPYSDGVWETVDDSLLEYTPDCYISRNGCAFAKYESWSYYVMPASEGETYRVHTIAGQHAAPWIAVSTKPDIATLTRANKIACSPIKGPTGYLAEEFTVPAGTKYLIFNHRTSSTYPLKVEKKSKYRYGISSQYWEECNGLWGHGGRGHAVQDQSPIQGTIVQGVRLNLGRVGSLNIYKIPSLFGSTEDNFQLVASITTDSLGLQDIDFPTPIYVGENEYLVFGKPSEITPTLTPMYNTLKYDTFKQNFVHFIGTDKVKKAGTALMVDFY